MTVRYQRDTANFTHPALRPVYVNSVTRRLCAGTYLDDEFAYEVIKETTEDQFRAIPPSLEFDLVPVILHAFRARRLLLIRDLTLSAIFGLGLFVLPGLTIAWALAAYTVRLAVLDRRLPRRDRRPGQLVAVLLASGAIAACFGGVSPLMLLAGIGTGATENSREGFGEPTSSGILSGLESLAMGTVGMIFVLFPVVLTTATLAVIVFARIALFRTLLRSLARNNEMIPDSPDENTGRRISWIAGAQYGIVSLHATNPFIGFGSEVVTWSVELSLQGKVTSPTGPRSAADGGRFQRDASFDPQAVSALDLHDRVRQSVLKLAGESLPPHQRVPGVRVLDRVVAGGERYQGDPLIDGSNGFPLTNASPWALGAIIHHPQGGVRYYQQVLIGVEGRDVVLPDGRPVLPAQPQDIVVSAHLHVAVEGGKLYVEFIGMVLPPIRSEFNKIDRLRPELGWLFTQDKTAVLWGWLNSACAPARVLKFVRQARALNARGKAARQNIRQFRSYDHGARVSIRELGAEDWNRTSFLQNLDAWKYIKILEKTTLETVLDYLDQCGADTSEYRTQMNHIQNNQTILNNANFNGPTAVGSNAKAVQL